MNTRYFPYKKLNDLLSKYDVEFSRVTEITLNDGEKVDGYSFTLDKDINYNSVYYTIIKKSNGKYSVGKLVRRGCSSYDFFSKKENTDLTFKQLIVILKSNIFVYEMINI